MNFGDFFKRPTNLGPAGRVDLDQGMYYAYMIIGLQVFFVLVLVAVIMVVGNVIMTPLWVYACLFVLMAIGCAYVYRKIKRVFVRFRDKLENADLSGSNFEISIMGGFLTMRVEQNAQRMLEAPPAHSDGDGDVVDAEVEIIDAACKPSGRASGKAVNPVKKETVLHEVYTD